jgi:hypothetical protein
MRRHCECCGEQYEVVEIYEIDGALDERFARCNCGARALRDDYNPYRDPDFERSPFED